MNFNPKTWQPVKVSNFKLSPEGSTATVFIRGGEPINLVLTAKRCPLPERITCSGSKQALFCSRDGHFFSLTDGGATLREVKPNYTPGMQNYKGGSKYPQMSHFDYKNCHHLMWETWVGPRTKGMQIDHVNGNKMDWSLANLEEVTPAENRKRAKILRCMRDAGNDPKQYSPARLKAIFAQYELMDGDTQMKREMSRHQEH